MVGLWYAFLALMLTVYVVLDGFDLGAGIVHLSVARSDEERRTVLAAIGPVWDGNEVWLIAAGGTLVFTFPRAYAASFSGFYLPLMMTLWLLVLRGLSIELRRHADNPLWHTFFDFAFCVASTVLAFVLGASIGNVIRGVPLGPDQTFHMSWFTNFHAAGRTGALDWYTILVGAFAVLTLAVHGLSWLAHKTEVAVQARSRRMLRRLWPLAIVSAIALTAATGVVDTPMFARFVVRWWAWLLSTLIIAGPAVAWWARRRGKDRLAFIGSSSFLVGLLLTTAAAMFPVILPSTLDTKYDLTAHTAANTHRGLLLGLWWWIPALLLAFGYFFYLFRSFAGKVRASHY